MPKRQFTKKRILVIEHNRKIIEQMCSELGQEGFEVFRALDGAAGLAYLKRNVPSLLILDLGLSDVPAVNICDQVREDDLLRHTPILILTANGSEADIVAGFEIGTDGCISKPCDRRGLVARVKTLLRRAEKPPLRSLVLQHGFLIVDSEFCSVSYLGLPIQISFQEFRLLYFLASHPNCAFNREQLLKAVWWTDPPVSPRNVDVYIQRLRQKFELVGRNPLQTVRGVGYSLVTTPYSASDQCT